MDSRLEEHWSWTGMMDNYSLNFCSIEDNGGTNHSGEFINLIRLCSSVSFNEETWTENLRSIYHFYWSHSRWPSVVTTSPLKHYPDRINVFAMEPIRLSDISISRMRQSRHCQRLHYRPIQLKTFCRRNETRLRLVPFSGGAARWNAQSSGRRSWNKES